MDKNSNRESLEEKAGQPEELEKATTPQEETLNEHASTYQPDIHPPQKETTEANSAQQEKQKEEKKINFDFEKSLDESKGIFKDALLRPHSLIISKRSISIETNLIIFAILTILLGVVAYFSVGNFMDQAYGGFGSLFGASIGIDFLFKTMLGWLVSFTVGYFSLYFMFAFFGNRKMEHRLLLTQYAAVNIPFVLVFCVVFILFGFLLIDLFMVIYIFSLTLFGMIHVYLFLTNVKKPKYDLFWLSSAYLFVLIIATYLATGIGFGIF